MKLSFTQHFYHKDQFIIAMFFTYLGDIFIYLFSVPRYHLPFFAIIIMYVFSLVKTMICHSNFSLKKPLNDITKFLNLNTVKECKVPGSYNSK